MRSNRSWIIGVLEQLRGTPHLYYYGVELYQLTGGSEEVVTEYSILVRELLNRFSSRASDEQYG